MFCGEFQFIRDIEDGPNQSIIVNFKTDSLPPLKIQAVDPMYVEDLNQLRQQGIHSIRLAKSLWCHSLIVHL